MDKIGRDDMICDECRWYFWLGSECTNPDSPESVVETPFGAGKVSCWWTCERWESAYE